VEKENKKEKFERELMGAKLCGKSHCASFFFKFFLMVECLQTNYILKYFFIEKYIIFLNYFLYQGIKIT
jgi:hypothetical protein